MADPFEPQDPDSSRRSPGRTPKDDPSANGERRARTLMYLAVAILAAVAFMRQFVPHTTPGLPYWEFKQQVRQGRVEEVLIGEEVIRGRRRPATPPPTATAPSPPPARAQPPTSAPSADARPSAPSQLPRALSRRGETHWDFETVRVRDDQLIALLEEMHVRYAGEAEQQSYGWLVMYVLIAVAVVGLWRAAMRRMQGQTGGGFWLLVLPVGSFRRFPRITCWSKMWT